MGILRSDVVSHSQLEPTGSVAFDGTGDSLSFSLTASGIGDGDFTLEYFVYQNTLSNYQTHFGVTRGSTGFNVGTDAGGVFTLYDQVSSAARKIEVSGAIEINRWYHWAFVRSGSTITGYLDGEAIGLPYSQSANYSGATCTIGCLESNAEYMNGFISNFRLVRGAIYKNNFTPPKFELKNVPGTLLLCCQSSSSATTAAVKPGTITANGNAAASAFIPDVKKDIIDTGVVLGDNTKFDTLSYMVPPGGTTTESNRGRGLFMGGYAPSQYKTTIDYIQIQSTGNAIDFGVLSGTGLGEGADCASSTRAIQGGGSLVNTMEYVTIATTSNTTDFGDLTVARRSLQSLSNETRGTWAGGTTNPAMSDVIDYVTIATTGNATDFGNLTVGRRNLAQAASSTRGVWAGGNPGSGPLIDDTIDYITIASAGNATDFGNLSGAYREMSGCSNGTRGVFGGGSPGPTQINTMEYITIATAGNVTDFGDLFYAQGNGGGTSNGTRGIFAGGAGAAYTNVIQYVTIATTGNAADFGDLTLARILYSATSDSHGGLS